MTDYNSPQLLQNWEQKFIEYLHDHETDDYSHDLSHFQRVWKTAQKIMAEETRPVNALTVLAACYFHDIVTFPKNHPNRSKSSQFAAQKTAEILGELKFPAELIENTCHAVEAHSFSANIPTRTPEAEVVQDADRMEAIGAIGLARVFYTGGKMGSKLFHAQDPWAENRELDDKQYSVDHFFCKLLKLGETMKTAPGRKLAEENTDYLRAFLDKLREELG
ncbi:phosphohydrolase [Sansalvadorimonas sp. 2012CJ34-2]|uniref:Phosphohydrolase n=1 Tax=Parendozoicomonas callyspongiae TaxID=2942213 RepID=A0ABT0PKS6_9GAMM|nr:phosphohydrolase [Sansalvadorimonas sp. 2012CJ34-2]MCL6271964.1 phosphohydrolase [Sansalvadorimonas sp. 2012CJ34-2]